MSHTATREFVRIPKQEYVRLKTIQKRFGDFWDFFEHIREIKEAREEIKSGRTVSQEKLFKRLDL